MGGWEDGSNLNWNQLLRQEVLQEVLLEVDNQVPINYQMFVGMIV